jgi:polyphosphate kinase
VGAFLGALPLVPELFVTITGTPAAYHLLGFPVPLAAYVAAQFLGTRSRIAQEFAMATSAKPRKHKEKHHKKKQQRKKHQADLDAAAQSPASHDDKPAAEHDAADPPAPLDAVGNGESVLLADGEQDHRKISSKAYEKHLRELQIELVKLQQWVVHRKLKVVILFEGRDAAGKGGTIKRITESLNPRVCRVVALPAPTEREKTQWYFQRYVPHLPAGGEIVIMDRSWYNRAGVERVMGFCTEDEYREFLRTCPEFERMLARSGIKLVKYWFSVSNEEQERRFQGRIADPTKRWKLSPMDLHSRKRWVEYSMAKDAMFSVTDIKQAPWYVVPSDCKKRARLNCISHLLSLFEYEDLTPEPIELPPRQVDRGYVRPPISDQTIIPQVF